MHLISRWLRKMDCLTSLKGDSVMADKEFLIQDPQNETQIGRG